MAIESALLIPVPEAEPAVGKWRARFAPTAKLGVPAHITVLYPFLSPGHLDTGTLAGLDALFGEFPSFPFVLDEIRRWPDLIYLAPAPEEPFRALTRLVADRWPEAPPYEGEYADVVPHLTIAYTTDGAVADEIAADIAPQLPIASVARTVVLMVTDGVTWTAHTSFALKR
jgi:2'-5' RNA ligase